MERTGCAPPPGQGEWQEVKARAPRVPQTEPEGPCAPCRKLDSLIQTQARELSHLRQRLREARGVCSVLQQHLGDTTKAFEELLRSNDIDFCMGQSFREQLAQSGALVQRVSAKISGRESHKSQQRPPKEEVDIKTHLFLGGDAPEGPDEKTELLAIRSVCVCVCVSAVELRLRNCSRW